ncbi:MAG: hypothetical protein JO264_01170 [Acidisphaera sp.]|nr:hypothetical protein [Acidisphaera sp.]
MKQVFAEYRFLPLIFAIASMATPTDAQAPAGSAFDGTWSVYLICSATADGAFGYSYNFVAQVKNGLLHGEHGIKGQPDSLTIDGPIQPDGSALISASGLTGNPSSSVGRVPRQTPYSYHVKAHFDATVGTGTRLETRPCTMHFVKS